MTMTIAEYIKKKMKNSRMVGYTYEYSDEAELQNTNTGGVLTSEEHSRMSEIDFKDYFTSESALVKWYFSYLENINNLSVVSSVGVLIKDGKAKNILSLGCGPAINELLLKRAFQDDIRMVVTDYDRFIIDGVKKVCGDEMIAETFDFYNDDPVQTIRKYDIDTIIMIGSACSMDDKTYVRFLRKIRKTPVRNILTFEAGIQREWIRFVYPLGLLSKTVFLYFFNRDEFKKRAQYLENKVSYHAFNRTVPELKNIYKKGGFEYTRIGPVKNAGYDTYINGFLLR